MNLITNKFNRELNDSYFNLISFGASNKDNSDPVLKQKKRRNETEVIKVTPKIYKRLLEISADRASSVSAILEQLLPKAAVSGVIPQSSITRKVGKTKIKTLIDGGQIFDEALKYIRSAEKNIQIELFDFQCKEDLNISPSYSKVPGSKQQQDIYEELINKAEEKNSDGSQKVNIQVILDSKKWYKKSGNYYKNIQMIKRMVEAGIDVVPYPRPRQGGSLIQHVKFLAVDSKKVILGGMNWSNHSPVNHDACLSIETNEDKNPEKNSEVDNLIDTIFNNDWKFSWKMLGLYGAMPEKERHSNLSILTEILPEAEDYMRLIGDIFDTPKYKDRYEKGDLNLPVVKPVSNPAIKILVNSSREYKENDIYDKDFDNEAIRTYLLGKKDEKGVEIIKGKLDDPHINYLRLELFALANKEVAEKIKKRHRDGTLDVKIIVDPRLISELPGVNNIYLDLIEGDTPESRVPIEPFRVNKETKQSLHSKWGVSGHKDEKGKLSDLELIIGSANLSAVAMESNTAKGKRPDYKGFNAEVIKKINNKFKDPINKLENELNSSLNYDEAGKDTAFFSKDGSINYTNFLARKKLLNKKAKEFSKSTVVTDRKVYDKIRVLQGYYELVADFLGTQPRYKRGNHECAVVVSHQDIARNFIKQFERDWNYTTNEEKLGFTGNKNPKTQQELKVHTFNRFA